MKKTIKILACEWFGNIHPYTIQTSRAKHPVRMIEGGDLLTEDQSHEYDPQCDMGMWGLNQKDYEWFKSHLTEQEVIIIE